MSVESWARRASGLFVPQLGFANLAGQMQPCASGDCCFTPTACTDCLDGSVPNTIWVDIPTFSDGDCGSCGSFAGTYELTKPGSLCYWNMEAFASYCTCITGNPDFRAWVQVSLVVVDSQCQWTIGCVVCFARTQSVNWKGTSGQVDPLTLDLTFPFFANVGGDCDATGTEVRVYV